MTSDERLMDEWSVKHINDAPSQDFFDMNSATGKNVFLHGVFQQYFLENIQQKPWQGYPTINWTKLL